MRPRCIKFLMLLHLISFCYASQLPDSKTSDNDQNALNLYAKIDRCTASSSFPSISNNGLPEFAAENSLKKGSSYWSSEGNHQKSDTVIFTGFLNTPRSIKGIDIDWAYSPQRVSIWVSLNGTEPFVNVVPFEDITSNEVSFEQKIFFPSPVRGKAIKILMQGPVHEYFGINFVQLIVDNTTVRLQSGITSVQQDMCLKFDESNEVVLEGCTSAIAVMDGNDLWVFNSQGQIENPIKNSCISLKDHDHSNGGTVILEDCAQALNHNDGRSIWELEKNNQLKLMDGGNYCISQRGTRAGSSDVAFKKEATTSSPRVQDNKHNPSMAIDGDSNTYWASNDFPLNSVPFAVYFDIDFGDEYKLKSLTIDWVYPAMAYDVSYSPDGKSWVVVASRISNSSKNTLDHLKSVVSRYIRLSFLKPHPNLSIVNNYLLYGIKNISVYSNRLKTIVEDCSTIATSSDARDKFFLESVYEVDLDISNKIRQSNAAILKETEDIMKLKSIIDEFLPASTACLEDKKLLLTNLHKVKTKLGNVKDKAVEIENPFENISPPATNEKLGYTSENPDEDCYSLKNKDPSMISGFYYIRPNCSPKPLRVYCDFSFGASYFVPYDNDISQITDIKRICADFGLKPVRLHSPAQFESLFRMLKMMEIDLKHPVPIATDVGGQVFFDLGLEADITPIIKSIQPTNQIMGNIAGIGENGLVYFDGSTNEMSAIICSTNKDIFDPGVKHVDISCASTIKNNPIFYIPHGIQVVVRCPTDCLDTQAAVIGTDTYDEESSICLSAIHSGVYEKGGMIVVTIIEGLDEYISSNQNGVVSDRYKGIKKLNSFKVSPLVYQCPNNENLINKTSFLEIHSNSKNPNINESNSLAEKKFISLDQSIDRGSANAIKQLLMLTASEYSSVDPAFLNLIEENIGNIISKARSILKPSEKLENKLRVESAELLLEEKEFSQKLKSLASKINGKLFDAQTELDNYLAELSLQTASTSWVLNIMNTSEIFDVFESKTSSIATGVGNWHIDNNVSFKIRSSDQIIAQTNSVALLDPNTSAAGTFLKLKNKRFYDFSLSLNIYTPEIGAVGIAFRVHDWDNMYLFEMKQFYGGFKRLIRIDEGEPWEISRVDDGGFLPNTWYSVIIEARRSRIKVFVSETMKSSLYVEPIPIIDVLDGMISSGSIALYTTGEKGGHFSSIKVNAFECIQQATSLLPPRPPNCSNFHENYSGSFLNTWYPLDPNSSVDGPSTWSYGSNIGGEKGVIIQTSPIKGSGQMTPSIAILKKHRSCDQGKLSLSYLPQCEKGIIGIVFNYKNSHNYNIVEFGPLFARIRNNSNGEFTTISQSLLGGYKLGSWNKVSIYLNNNNAVIHLADDTSTVPLFNIAKLPYNEGGAVGLSTYNCPGIAFSNIIMHPHETQFVQPKESLITPSLFIKTESGIRLCSKKNHYVDRLEYCRSNFKHDQSMLERCNLNFCDSCCEKEFKISPTARVTCKNHCHSEDYFGVITEKSLKNLQESCAIEKSKKLFQTCHDEPDSEKKNCLIEMCSMCCRTSDIEKNMHSFKNNKLLIDECERQCSNTVNNNENMEL